MTFHIFAVRFLTQPWSTVRTARYGGNISISCETDTPGANVTIKIGRNDEQNIRGKIRKDGHTFHISQLANDKRLGEDGLSGDVGLSATVMCILQVGSQRLELRLGRLYIKGSEAKNILFRSTQKITSKLDTILNLGLLLLDLRKRMTLI